MDRVWSVAEDAIRRAHAMGLRYVLFTHGASTSRPGQTTARSMIRSLLRGKEMTPFILRAQCIQHDTCFVAALRPNPAASRPALVCPKCGAPLIPKSAAGSFRCKPRGDHGDWSWLDVDKQTPGGSAGERR